MAVAALFDLKHKSTLPLQCACAVQKFLRHRIATPSVHVRAPRSESSELRECPERYRDQHHRQNRDGPPAPTLFSFAGKERQKKQAQDDNYWTNEKCWRFHRRRQQR